MFEFCFLFYLKVPLEVKQHFSFKKINSIAPNFVDLDSKENLQSTALQTVQSEKKPLTPFPTLSYIAHFLNHHLSSQQRSLNLEKLIKQHSQSSPFTYCLMEHRITVAATLFPILLKYWLSNSEFRINQQIKN